MSGILKPSLRSLRFCVKTSRQYSDQAAAHYFGDVDSEAACRRRRTEWKRKQGVGGSPTDRRLWN